jgi:hypothetical protein
MPEWCTGIAQPSGIAVDSTGRAFVTSSSMNVVYVCPPMGGVAVPFVTLIAPGTRRTPGLMYELALTRSGDLLIATQYDGIDPSQYAGGVWRVNNTGAVCVFNAQNQCEVCAAGRFVSAGPPSSCAPCAAGRLSAAVGANSSDTCVQCDAGTWSSVLGASSSAMCTQCDAGTASTMVGATNATVHDVQCRLVRCVRCEQLHAVLCWRLLRAHGFQHVRWVRPRMVQHGHRCQQLLDVSTMWRRVVQRCIGIEWMHAMQCRHGELCARINHRL